MKYFSCKTKITLNSTAQAVLKQLGIGKLLVVSDPFFAENGTAASLGQQAENYEIFSKVMPDPTVQLVAEGTALVQRFLPDAVLALGGGSAMDCAKAMVFFSGQSIPLIAVPTTSGSGSEVTDFAILTHDGVKHPLVDERLRPDMAILDHTLVSSLTPGLIADGGFDALTHALESWVAVNADPISDALALQAFHTIYQHLGDSFVGDTTARRAIHTASTMAGLAFSHAGLGVCHALSHALGGQFHIPHGRLNAILLPAVIAHNGAAGRYADLARHLGLGTSDAMAVRNLKNGLIRLRTQLGLPSNLRQAGTDPALVRQKLPTVLAAAMADPCCQTNPTPVTEELLRSILKEVAALG